jgi:hypothetical protein
MAVIAAVIASLHGLLILMMEPINSAEPYLRLGSGQLVTVLAALLVLFGGLGADRKQA